MATGEQPGTGWRTFLMILAWGINIVIAEYVIRHKRLRFRRHPLRSASSSSSTLSAGPTA
jgi:hypothetical protein